MKTCNICLVEKQDDANGEDVIKALRGVVEIEMPSDEQVEGLRRRFK